MKLIDFIRMTLTADSGSDLGQERLKIKKASISNEKGLTSITIDIVYGIWN